MNNMNYKSKKIYELQANICQALSSPIRLEILDNLSDKEMTSSELLDILEIPKANLSQHLTVLKDAGILKVRKEAQFQYLSIGIPKIKDACELVGSILAEQLIEDEKHVIELRKNLNASNVSKKKVKK